MSVLLKYGLVDVLSGFSWTKKGELTYKFYSRTGLLSEVLH